MRSGSRMRIVTYLQSQTVERVMMRDFVNVSSVRRAHSQIVHSGAPSGPVWSLLSINRTLLPDK